MRWHYLWSLVSPEVLPPSRAPCILLQTLLLCPPITITTINWWDQMRNNLFWNQTWTTLMSRPVSVASCSLTCRAGFGEVLYAFFNTCNINAGIHVGILSAFFIWTCQEKTHLTAPPSAGLWSWSVVACSRHPLHNQQLWRDFNAGMENVSFFCFGNYCFP